MVNEHDIEIFYTPVEKGWGLVDDKSIITFALLNDEDLRKYKELDIEPEDRNTGTNLVITSVLGDGLTIGQFKKISKTFPNIKKFSFKRIKNGQERWVDINRAS